MKRTKKKDRMVCFFFAGDPSKLGAALADAIKRLVPPKERRALLRIAAGAAANRDKVFK